jgi:hypothetical protein
MRACSSRRASLAPQLNVENLLDENLLREREQQQQHHAGLAVRGACCRDHEFLDLKRQDLPDPKSLERAEDFVDRQKAHAGLRSRRRHEARGNLVRQRDRGPAGICGP